MPAPLTYVRLRPIPGASDQQDAISGGIHDPLWFLSRQWQLGEFQGENATTPVAVEFQSTSKPVSYPVAGFDPAVVPAEAIVESELDDWWTMGRRLRAGAAFASHHGDLSADGALTFVNPPAPYEHFTGAWDGLALWKRFRAGGLPPLAQPVAVSDFGETPPAETVPAWDDFELVYSQVGDDAFTAFGTRLQARRHRGGRMDWYSVDAVPALPGGDDEPASATRIALPTRLTYPGMPIAGTWELEDPEKDIGGAPPDSAHTATAIMTELYFAHSDEWFVFPASGRPGASSVSRRPS